MRKKKRVTITKEYLDSLKAELDQAKKERDAIHKDRRKFRIFFRQLLKDNVWVASRKQYYSPEVMIDRLSKLMNNVEAWDWGWE